MAKLSNILENVEKQSSYEIDKRKYFAKKLMENIALLENSGSKNTFVIVEEILLTEAGKYGSKEKAVMFLEGIEEELLKEGFITDTIKAGASLVGKGIKKVFSKVKDMITGPIMVAMNEFYTVVKPAAENLMKYGIKESLDKFEYNYLFEAEAESSMLTKLISGRGRGLTGISSAIFKKYYVTKSSGGPSTLWVGATPQEAKAIATFIKPSLLVLNLDDTIFTSAKEMELIKVIFEEIISNTSLNPDTAYSDEVELTATTINIKHNTAPQPIKPGFKYNIWIASKSKTAIGKKSVMSQADFIASIGAEAPAEVEPEETPPTGTPPTGTPPTGTPPTETPPTGTPPTTPPEPENKVWLQDAITKSGVTSDNSEIFTKLGVDPKTVWDKFIKFAAKHSYKLPAILLASHGKGNFAPMSSQEFIGYAYGLYQYLGHIETEIAKGTMEPQIYGKKPFLEFLTTIIPAASKLSETLEKLNYTKAASTGTPPTGTPPTGTPPAAGTLSGFSSSTVISGPPPKPASGPTP